MRLVENFKGDVMKKTLVTLTPRFFVLAPRFARRIAAVSGGGVRPLRTLCSLAVPADGRLDTFHVKVIYALFTAVHDGMDGVADAWPDVFACMERLGELSVSSPKLSDESYDEAVALSSGFARLAEFTAAAGDGALGDMLKALKDVSPTRPSRAEVAQGSGAHHAPLRLRAAQQQQHHHHHQQQDGGGGGFGSRLLGLARNTLQNLSQQVRACESRSDEMRRRVY